MTSKKRQRKPVLGPAFDADQMNEAGRIIRYIDELEWYRPRGFSKLAREGRGIARACEADDFTHGRHEAAHADEWMREVCDLLTTWARRVDRHHFIGFGPFEHSGDVGFYIDVESAQADADLSLPAGDSVPRGFSGLAVFVNDHGNVDAATYSRGRKCRDLFSVV